MKKTFTILIAALMLLTMISQPTRLWGQAKAALFTETFNNCTGTMGWSGSAGNGTFSADNTWTTSNAYGAGGAAKFGTGSKQGSAETPSITVTGGSKLTLTFKAGAWSGDATTLNLSSTNCTLKQNGSAITSVTLENAAWTTYTVDVEVNDNVSSIKIQFQGKQAKNSRFLLDDVIVTPKHSITYAVSPSGSGSVGGVVYGTSTVVASGAYITEGGKVTLTAEPASGYTFSSWSDGGTNSTLSSTTTNPTTFTMGTANATVTANFSAASGYITVSPTTANVACAGDDVEFTVDTDQTLDDDPTQFYTTSTGDVTTTKPAWIGDILYDEGEMVVEVSANTGAARTAYFKVEKGSVKSDVITINQAAYAPAAPTLPAAGNFDYTKEITITVPSGTTVYYTLDGTNPTSGSTEYSAPFTINATKTLKAVAYDNGYPSSVVSATYTRTYDYISSISSTSTYYTVKGTVVATNTKGFVFGDATGYIYDYYATSIPSVGSVVSITNQKVSTYGKVYEFKAASSSDSGSAYTSDTPTIIDGDDMYTVMNGSTNYISNYQQFVGTLTKSGSNYFFEVAGSSHTSNAMISYPTEDQSDDLDDLDGEIVKVNGYFTGVATVSSTSYYSVMLESVEACPLVTTSVSAISNFTYNYGGGPDAKNFTVTGANLTNDITISTNSANFEISSNNSNWQTSDITISKGSGTVAATTIYVRLKSGLDSNTYNGKITVSSDGANDKEIALTGTVTHVIAYNTSLPTGCSVSSEPNGAQVAGESVSLTATAGSGYKFSAWDVYKTGDPETEVTVTDNAFIMPAYNVTVSATFVPAYTVTYAANGGSGTMTDENSPYIEGAQVTLLSNTFTYAGHTWSSWSVKDASQNDVEISDGKFTMPASNVTVTAQWNVAQYNVALSSVANVDLLASYGVSSTIAEGANANVDCGTEITLSATNMTAGKVFVWKVQNASTSADVTSDVLNGVTLTVPAYNITISGQVAELYVKYTGAISEGDYIICGNNSAMKNTLNSNRFYLQSVSPANNQIVITTDASAYVWHIAANGDYWTIYNTAVEKYAIANGSSTSVGLQEGLGSDSKPLWSFVQSSGSYTITSKYNTDNSGNTQLKNGGSYFACYASGSDNYLYKKVSGSMHSVTIAGGIDNGSISATPTSAYEGQSVSLTATPSDGYMLASWNVYKTGDESTKVTVTGNSFAMPGYDVTVSATFRVQHTYTLVDGSDVTLVPGKHYLIASTNSTNYYVMGAQNGSVRNSVPASLSGSKILEDDGFYEVVISGDNTNNWTMYSVKDEGYLYATGASSANINVREDNVTTNPTYGQWSISVSSGTATITTVADLSYKYFKYNHNGGTNPRFACYTTGQTALKLYVKDGDTDLEFHSPTTLASATIASTETYTIESGQVLEVTGSLTNNGTAANLVIEDGGILITKSSGVKATVKKNVTESTNWGTTGSYTPDGWYFIASPVDDAAFPTGTVDNQDIYQLDWANNKWLNLQNDANSSLFDAGFQSGTGYLYASKDGNTISVAGAIQALSNDDNATVTLANTGWNLIGNPLTCKVTVSSAFSELNGGSAVTNKDANNTINPFQGIAVYGNAGTTVTFTKATTQNAAAPSNNSSLQMTLAKKVTSRGETSSKVVDNAVVSFNESQGLPKFTMLGGNVKLYIPQNDEEYAVAFSNKHGDVPLNFKTDEVGTYTISFEGEEMDLNGIYLIDILDEQEIDLNAEPSYTFIGSPADRAARFKIVFRNVDGDNNSDIFAYQNGSDIVVTGEGELQIFDVMGRIVSKQYVSGVETMCTSSVPTGVYIFKLNGMTQKIVVR